MCLQLGSFLLDPEDNRLGINLELYQRNWVAMTWTSDYGAQMACLKGLDPIYYSILLYSLVFYFVLLCSILFYSVLLYSLVFYFVLFCSILFYSILFYSILFYSTTSVMPLVCVYDVTSLMNVCCCH